MRRRLYQAVAVLLVTTGSWTSVAGAEAAPGCEIGAWSTDKDPNGLNIRAAPGADSPVIGNIPPPMEIEGDLFASEVSITGSHEGWFRIESAYFIDYYLSEKDQVFFEGEGWVSGRYLGLNLEGDRLFAAPSREAAVTFVFSENPDAHDNFVLERLHACLGYWVEVEGTSAGERIRGWTNDTCSSQVTTCP